jgi:hypothetical protein
MEETLHLSLYFFDSARSSARNIALFPVAPEVADCPLISAVKAAEKIKSFIPDGRYNIIVSQ